MLTVKLQGGLGNQLFQLATAEAISKKTHRIFYLSSLSSPKTIHSNEEYFNSIFKKWSVFLKSNIYRPTVIQENSKMELECWDKRITKYNNVLLDGYFQSYTNIEPVYDQFVSRLVFNESILSKYPNIHEYIFVHIRGGDYKNSKFHELDLKNYYKNAFELFSGEKFYIFTNDKEYSKQFLHGLEYDYINESEIDSLYLMSKCKGGICANSSFSWWGAYLNKNRQLVMPSKWYNDEKMYIDGYYFDKVIRLDIV